MPTALRIEQKQFLKPWNSFELLPSGELLVATKGSGGRQEMRLDLCNLSPKTGRFAKSATSSLVALIVFSLIYFGIVAMVITSLRNDFNAWVGISVICGMIGLLMLPLIWSAFARWHRLSYDVTVFYNRWNSQAAVSIENQVPDPATVERFITEIVSRVEKAAPVEVRGDSLVDQLARLSELHTKGVLSAEEFASAKQRLLKGGLEEKHIGF